MNKLWKGAIMALFAIVFGFAAWYFPRDVDTGFWVLNNVIFPILGIAIGFMIYSAIFRGNR